MSDGRGGQREWRFYLDDMIVATRNRLIHGYLGIDDDTLWSIVRDEVPPLPAALKALRQGTH